VDQMLNNIYNRDSINPTYYKQGEIEVIDFILDQNMDYLTANVQKYISRWKFKDGIDDLRKARWFLDKLIEQQMKNSVISNKLSKIGEPK